MNWPQLKTILWLRWRLTRNQWARGGGIGGALAAIVGVFTVIMSIGGLLAGIAAGAVAMRTAEPMVLTIVWLALSASFLFFWLIGLLTDLQKAESIDLQKLLHLPVQLGQIFTVNYVASLMAISVVIYVPAAIGLSLGLAYSRGPRMLLMIPLALSMVFMVSALTYLLRGWLATLMSNPRRRRTIIMALTMAFIFIFQAPNIYFNVIKRDERRERRAESREARKSETPEARETRRAEELQEVRSLLQWQAAVPPLWVSAAAEPLDAGRPLPAALGLLGCAGIGVLALRRAYRSTLRFYQGDTGGRAAARGAAVKSSPRTEAPDPAPGTKPRSTRLIDRVLPGVPDQAAVVGLASFQAMLRAPEIKMQWGTSFLVTLVVGGPMLFRSAASIPPWAGPFIATALIVFQMFLVVGIVANQFGLDRDGFRAFVLSPVERWKILLGKNLAAFPVAAGFSLILVTILAVWLRLSPIDYVATLLQLVVAVVLASMAGNIMSILVPYRINPGTMKPAKMPPLAMIAFIFCQLMLPIALTPTFVAPLAGYLLDRWGYAPAAVVNLGVSACFAASLVFVYWRVLGPTGRLLQRRETKILQTVSEAIE